MNRVLLSTVSVLALTFGASAADLPVKAPRAPIPAPVLSWTGFYLGIQGGVARHEGSFNDLDGSTVIPTVGPKYKSDKTGGIAGVNAGYNWQAGSLVFGVEGDWSWLGAKSDARTLLPVFCATCFVGTSFDVQWLATARARLGVAMGATLLYATGGAAFGDIKNFATTNFGGINWSQSKTKTGWTAGGGLEYMFAPNWTGRLDVRYVDFGKSGIVPCTPVGTCFGYRGEFSNTLLTGMVGIDFKF